MSKTKKTTSAPKLIYNTTQNLPTLKKYPTCWDMKGQYYKSVADPQIERDVTYTESIQKKLVKKYRDSDFCSNAKTLYAALTDFNRFDEDPRVGKATRYLGLRTTLDTGDEEALKKLNLLGQRLTKSGNELLFFSLRLAKVSNEQQKKFLKDPLLADFRYDLKTLFADSKYQLSEAEEKLLRQLTDCSYGMWVDMTEKMMGKRSVMYKGEHIPVNAAFGRLSALPFKEQPKLWSLIMKEIEPLRESVEHELTAICTRKKIEDELRGYNKPYSATVKNYEDNEKSVEALVQAVSTRGFTLSKKFYKLKAKLHKQNKIAYAQRGASLGKAPVVDFAQATEICRDVFYGVNPEYGQIFDRLLTNGQIDVYPKKGKTGGAFCSGQTSQPTNVLLNQTDTVRSLETYAHEMGHAIHTERSKLQPAHYQEYSTTTAETASTLFEGLLFDAILTQASPAQKTLLLHDKISGDISTIQRQIAFHNFELNMHQHVREQGAITHIELNQMMQKHLSSYCGPAVEVGKLDGNSYIYVGHFRYGFYVYTYAFGILMSSIMADKFIANNAYSAQIDKFLTSGGKDTVAEIFKSIGIDTGKIGTFELGLNKMEKEINTLAKLTKQ